METNNDYLDGLTTSHVLTKHFIQNLLKVKDADDPSQAVYDLNDEEVTKWGKTILSDDMQYTWQQYLPSNMDPLTDRTNVEKINNLVSHYNHIPEIKAEIDYFLKDFDNFKQNYDELRTNDMKNASLGAGLKMFYAYVNQAEGISHSLGMLYLMDKY